METRGYRPKSKKLQQKLALQESQRRFPSATGESILQSGSGEYRRISGAQSAPPRGQGRSLLGSPLVLIAFLVIGVYLSFTKPVVGLILLGVVLLGALFALVLWLRNR